MANITQVIVIRDSTVTSGDNRKTGLTPSWLFLKALSDSSNIASPSISEIAGGQYKFTYNAEINGEAAGQIDAGASLINPSDRYIDVIMTKEEVVLASNGLDNISIAPPSAVPTTFREIVIMVYRRFFKKVTLTSSQLKTYADDNATIITTQAVSDDSITQSQNASS